MHKQTYDGIDALGSVDLDITIDDLRRERRKQIKSNTYWIL